MTRRGTSFLLTILAACGAPTPSTPPVPATSAEPAYVRSERAKLEACAKERPSAVRVILRYDGERVALESCDALDGKVVVDEPAPTSPQMGSWFAIEDREGRAARVTSSFASLTCPVAEAPAPNGSFTNTALVPTRAAAATVMAIVRAPASGGALAWFDYPPGKPCRSGAAERVARFVWP